MQLKFFPYLDDPVSFAATILGRPWCPEKDPETGPRSLESHLTSGDSPGDVDNVPPPQPIIKDTSKPTQKHRLQIFKLFRMEINSLLIAVATVSSQ